VQEQLPERKNTGIQLTFPLGPAAVTANVQEAVTADGVKLFLIEKDEFYDRTKLYGNASGDYDDTARRFIFFSKAVAELARYVQPAPDILHLHDWQTGLVPALIRAGGWPFRTVYTIHNLAYQGSFWAFDFDLCNLPGEYFSAPGVEFYGRLNCMKAGITLAHQITTVSPRYAREIQTVEFGCGLEKVLQENQHKLTGILNGVDTQAWNPGSDPHLAARYNARSMKGKESCKQALLRKWKWSKTTAPLYGVVSRLTGQKGFDLLAEVLEKFLQQDVRLVVLGSGDPVWETYFRQLAQKYPDKIGVQIGFDEALAHQIEAGCDFFLMPSLFEPCGLNQMYSLRYGTLPLVHDTGGLADSVVDAAEPGGNGFKFSPYTPAALWTALQQTEKVYLDKAALRKMRREGMKKTFSWEESAAQYEKVYEKALL
jgi:starch synthase